MVEEMQPRWLAFLNEEHDLAFARLRGVRQRRLAQQQARPEPAGSAASRWRRCPALDLTFAYFNMEDSGRRRLHAREGGAAPRDLARLQHARRDRDRAQGPGDPRADALQPRRGGLRPELPHQRQRVQRPEGARAARHVRLRRPRRRRLPRDGPTAAPWCCENASTPSARDQQIDELWKRSMDDVGLKMTFRKAKWPDLLKESNAGKLMMWQLGGAASVAGRRHLALDALRPELRVQGQPRALPAGRLRPPLREGPRDARLPGAHEAVPGAHQAHGGLRAVEGEHAPHPHGHVVSVGGRLPPPAVQSNNFWKYIDIDLSKRPPAAR